jgi:hypothetical protein
LAIHLKDALALISSFSNTRSLQFITTDNASKADSCIELVQYLQSVCPRAPVQLTAVGHPVDLLATAQVSAQPDMFTQLSGELGHWDSDWLLIAHEGGDPIIVKPSEQGEFSPVYSAMQGMGFWDFAPIADSIGQFLVCASAIQHALNFPGLGQPLDDDFNLAPAAAHWLFPFLRQHAGAHYDEWASVFENYLSY